ncbi:MAG: hypothetical protein ACRDKG_07620 [Actinomycetota bacterium]
MSRREPARRRFRRNAVARGHLEVAQDRTEEAPVADAADEGDRAKVKRATKTRTSGGTDMRAFVRANARILAAVALLIVGIVIVLLGWYGAAHTNILTEQVPYLISGGLLGMALIIVAAVIGSSASLERENRELRRDLTRLLSSGGQRFGGASLAPASRGRTDDGSVYVVPGGRSFHTSGCPIVEGKQGSEMSLEDARDAGFSVCKLCGD